MRSDIQTTSGGHAAGQAEGRPPIKREASLQLSIIIVSWNVRELLDACLRSIERNRGQIDLEVIVVDSASADGSPVMIAELYPWVKLMAQAENVGFPRGNNLGLQVANGEYLLLLNPDTVVLDDALSQMVAYLNEHVQVGVVGGKLLNPDGSVQSSRRRFPTLATAVFESTWLQPYAPKGILQHYYAEDMAHETTGEVDWLVGACLMVRREAIVDAGLMDEAYFMYSEELDWCRRIKKAGWRIVYLPAARIVHHVGKSSEQATTQRHINYQRAKVRYFYKYHGLGAGLILRAVLLMNYAWQWVLEAVKYVLGHKRALRRQRMGAYWLVLRSGLPPAGC